MQKPPDSFELALFGDINAWLIVKAPGYETWRLQLSFNLKTSRELTGPVRLQRVKGEGECETPGHSVSGGRGGGPEGYNDKPGHSKHK